MRGDNVVDFRRYRRECEPAGAEDKPYATGAAVCLDCRHEWQAVAPIGTVDHECPQCRTTRGVWKGLHAPASGMVWQCKCGNPYFLLLPHGPPMCSRCGLRATSWVDA